MSIWHFIHQNLSRSIPVILLVVIDSQGSSPGRQGFKMVVTSNGDFLGTIGGGIMEQKLVEKAKQMLSNKESVISIMHQYHDKQHPVHQSGMICSGSQINAFVPLSENHKASIDEIMKHLNAESPAGIQISPTGLSLRRDVTTNLELKNDAEWIYTEPVFQQPVLHIFGGGHISLALSEVMTFIGFYVKVYDDRLLLNTLEQNVFAKEKHIINYENIAKHAIINPNDFIVISSVGYRTDKLILKQLLDKTCVYLGLLGSMKKIEKLFIELKNEGTSQAQLNNVFAPIGLNIASKTSGEIAISIAAEIIREKNKTAPSARIAK